MSAKHIQKPNMALWDVTNLTCVRGGETILKNLSFSVQKCDFIAILGPNGAGKSTLLRTLLRIQSVEKETHVELDGRDLFQLTPREIAHRVAYVPQAQPQHFPLTARQFVEAARYAYQSPWDALSTTDRMLCTEALERVHAEKLAGRELGTLSGGELQRVWLAGALAQNADILLLDEAVSQMDYRARMETFQLLRTLNREEGKTILMITHDINEATQNANRILALKDGKIIFDGETSGFLTEKELERVFDAPFLLVSAPELTFPVAVLRQ